MAGHEHIFAKEATYRTQMADARAALLSFLEPKGWEPLHRGRRAHVSACGPIGAYNGIVDVEMVETDWNRMPAVLEPSTQFTLWCSADHTRGGMRLFADTEVYWQSPFSSLLDAIHRFLPVAWHTLERLGDSNFAADWPGPSTLPDLPPSFGPSRPRRTAGARS